jgi:hypothetical protein
MRLFALLLAAAAALPGTAITPFYSGSYTLIDLGSAAGVPAGYGALTFMLGNSDILLLSGHQDNVGGIGEIDAVPVIRGAGGHIVGFGAAVFETAATYIDSGLVYAPNGDLLYLRADGHGIGVIPTGAAFARDAAIPSPAGPNDGTLGIVPAGLPGGGSYVFASAPDRICTAALSPTAGGYTISSCIHSESVPISSGIAWIPAGASLFPSAAALVLTATALTPYTLDSYGLPQTPYPQPLAVFSGGIGPNGMTVDPVTGDLLISTAGSHILEIQDPPPPPVPEPPAPFLVALGLATVCASARMRPRDLL